MDAVPSGVWCAAQVQLQHPFNQVHQQALITLVSVCPSPLGGCEGGSIQCRNVSIKMKTTGGNCIRPPCLFDPVVWSMPVHSCCCSVHSSTSPSPPSIHRSINRIASTACVCRNKTTRCVVYCHKQEKEEFQNTWAAVNWWHLCGADERVGSQHPFKLNSVKRATQNMAESFRAECLTQVGSWCCQEDI